MSDTEMTQDATEKKAEFTDEDLVTVAHGYGRVPATERRFVDNVEFRGGVAHNVPYTLAKKWKAVPQMGKHIVILPEDASDADIARASNIQPMATPKFAAMLSAIDLDKLAVELGPMRAREIGQRLLDYAGPRVVKDAQGKFRSTKAGD